MEFITRPIEKWPRPETPERDRRSPFSMSYNRVLNSLEHELRNLEARDIILQLDVTDDEIRLDGHVRANARPRTPRVAIAFQSKFGPLTYYCDACREWQDNLYAIAKTLERLRLADLYGVTKRGEQYTGFRALPAAIEVGPAAIGITTVDHAAMFIAENAGDYRQFIPGMALPGLAAAAQACTRDKEFFKTLYRLACKRLHPDAGGDKAKWQALQAAEALLNKHHGI